MTAVKTRKKLIEVALPLDAINAASAREKSIRHGHPSTLHLWWARRPLAAARAVIFAQMVDDPSEYVETLLDVAETRKAAERELKRRKALWDQLPDDADREAEPTLAECAADLERQRLFRIIEDLVQWENTTNEYVLNRAREEIRQSWRRACVDNAGHPRAAELFDRHKLPAFHDPFAGGGALPLEAQRLGLEAHASDLNPVAVLINKAMIEIPPKFANMPPVNPDADPHRKWKGAEGLADDVRYYGKWMRDEAERRIGHLYPKVKVTDEMAVERPDLKPYVGRELTVIAWLWARTVKSPNPALRDVDVPLASTFILSAKAGRQVWVEPVVENKGYRFEVRRGRAAPGTAKAGTKLGRGANFQCLLSGVIIQDHYVKAESMAGRMGARLMAIVVEGDRCRLYLPPVAKHEEIARLAKPVWEPELPMNRKSRDLVSGRGFGFFTWADLFTKRQLVALTSLSDLVAEARTLALSTSANSELAGESYANAVAVYLALAIGKASDYNSSLVIWSPTRDQAKTTFARQALPMAWDYAETNVFAEAAGDLSVSIDGISKVLTQLGGDGCGVAVQADAQAQTISSSKVVSTDPPYYDNIQYADLSDFFYVWLRPSAKALLPELFQTVATPKEDELVANASRQGSERAAEEFFLNGMTDAMHRLSELAHPGFPTTIYYAFKQAETGDETEVSSTGWVTFLDAVVRAGFGITGTWPMRTERGARTISIDSNALASSIILTCRPQRLEASSITRRELLIALRSELPVALGRLQRGNIAPVDLAQAAIGPGMAVFTRYSKVIDAGGRPVSVGEAYSVINQVLDEVLAAQEGDFDGDTRWAVTWFDEMGFAEGEYGRAEQLSKAKNTAVAEMADPRNGGIIVSRAGKVRLRRPAELPEEWDPEADPRLTVWEMVHHLIRRMDEGGEQAAAELAAKLGVKAETAKELAYRLYTIADRRKRSADALPYNALVQSWPEITRLAREAAAAAAAAAAPAQTEMAV